MAKYINPVSGYSFSKTDMHPVRIPLWDFLIVLLIIVPQQEVMQNKTIHSSYTKFHNAQVLLIGFLFESIDSQFCPFKIII